MLIIEKISNYNQIKRLILFVVVYNILYNVFNVNTYERGFTFGRITLWCFKFKH